MELFLTKMDQLVNKDNGVSPYAQVRMITEIGKIFENRSDLDNGKIYERVYKTPEETIRLLNRGKVGKKQIVLLIELLQDMTKNCWVNYTEQK